MKSVKVIKGSGEIVYKCPHCGKEFRSPRSAGAHVFQCPVTGGVSEETRKKISASLKGRTISEEQKALLRESHKRENLSEETLRKMSEASSKKWTPEMRKRQSETLSKILKGNQRAKGYKHTEETRKHLSEVLSGRKLSEEDKKSKSIATQRTILNGTWNGFKNDDVGFYRSIRCKYHGYYLRSRYEAIYLCWLVSQGLEFEYEEIRLPYTDSQGKERIYIPDFHILDTHELVEIKGRSDLEEVISRSEEICTSHGYYFTVVIGDEIWEAYRQLENKGYNIKELYDKSKEVYILYKQGKANDVLNFDIVNSKIIFI